LNKGEIMLGVRLEPELEERLDWLAKKTGRTKSYHAKQAIKKYLEDKEDYLIAVAALERIENGKEKTISLEELVKKYALESGVLKGRREAVRSTGQGRANKDSRVRTRKTRHAV
jgi:RHH-type rel operon transcriptional repressor/antitoxin RelB